MKSYSVVPVICKSGDIKYKVYSRSCLGYWKYLQDNGEFQAPFYTYLKFAKIFDSVPDAVEFVEELYGTRFEYKPWEGL